MHDNDESFAEEGNETSVEGLDFDFEDGLMVLTRRYLSRRGYCCGGDCRHCPYEEHRQAASQ
ncbi:MAG: hypothetical protein KA956_02305 [Pyrinomonadaceae bacterium]|nr:hypothetical protein [Acidobacteriota bacterium]MBK7933330.1 hypothetical protein [Acidobacteriota bacterium]MBP7375289.1 hypothetical protein [Pyrinomonadaceae bacterium]